MVGPPLAALSREGGPATSDGSEGACVPAPRAGASVETALETAESDAPRFLAVPSPTVGAGVVAAEDPAPRDGDPAGGGTTVGVAGAAGGRTVARVAEERSEVDSPGVSVAGG